MKTLLLMDSLGTGGTERQMELLLRRWPGDGETVQVLAFNADDDGRARFEAVAPVEVAGRRGRRDLVFPFRLGLALERIAPDVILAPHRFAGLLALTVPVLGRRPPVVCCIRGRHRFTGVQAALYDTLHPRLMASRASSVLVNAEPVVDDLVARVPRLKDKIVLVPNGLDLHRFSRDVDRTALRRTLEIPGDSVIAVCVGRLVDVKAPFLAVDAMADPQLSGRNLHLCWVGDGSLRESVRRHAEGRGVQSRVHLLGELTDPVDVLLSADLYVHPSSWENTSNAILEAMAARLPVVARSVGGNPDLLGDGKRGTLVDTDSVEEFADACARCLDDIEESMRRAADARRHVESVFSVSSMVDTHLAVLRRAVERNQVR